ncbi:MAG TPA: ferritin-like domain-containing protein, partial [Acidimicrobiia bacterium]
MRDDNELIGRGDVNDVEAILAITNTDGESRFHDVGAEVDTRFTWDYERSRPKLGKLYEKAKVTQWNANDLPW